MIYKVIVWRHLVLIHGAVRSFIVIVIIPVSYTHLREQLLDHIWGYEYIGDTRTVDVHIKRLREKIKDHDKWALTTVWGIGYKFEVKR